MRYSPPATGNGLATQEVGFIPSGGGVKTQVDIKADMPGQIPINGWANAATLPVVNAVLDFMKARCIGAGSLGIARNGQVVAAIGLGMQVFAYATAGFRVDSTSQWFRVGPAGLLDPGQLWPGVLTLAAGLTLYLAGLFASVDSVRR